ncbi:hypothetical protein DFH08DRAFT_808606 [Mycena albidolilacea]|uniref:Uncharacterized protein n=1 Tax=Mycena albidolilacea TaxID=1033008 RepID=A0AAD7A1Q8_9AGAR|nr:hypothetical protein DFH08DRAFT_808606 [Mycena albidolilacea]
MVGWGVAGGIRGRMHGEQWGEGRGVWGERSGIEAILCVCVDLQDKTAQEAGVNESGDGEGREEGTAQRVVAYAEGTEKSAERHSSRERRRLSGSMNQTFLEGDEARNLLRLGRACVPENNECQGSRRMGQHAAEMVGAINHTLCGRRCGL